MRLEITASLRAAVALAIVGGLASSGRGASISYPDLGPVGPGYSFTGITESSGTDAVPLYGAPTAFVIGLNFAPANFDAASAGGVDLTDGQLNYTVVAGPGAPGIPQVSFSEGGTFSLGGTGTAATSVSAGAVIHVSVTEINGVSIAPIILASSSSTVAYDLAANPGAAQPWSLSATVNIAAQLSGLGYGPGQVATRVDVVVDNSLLAVSEPLGTASISKADFGVTLTIPEPGALSLVGVALAGFGRVRRSSRRGLAIRARQST
jgi:hypothetical protein